MLARFYETFVGFRYLGARGRRGFISFISMISMLGITVGVAVLVVVLSVMNGFESELRERILSMASHGTISGLDRPLADWQKVRGAAGAHPEVEATAPYIDGEGMLVNGKRLSAVLVRGVDPSLEASVSVIDSRMITGSLGDLAAGEYGIVLGKALAEAVGVMPGDRVVLMISQATVTPAGVMPRMRRFRVTGLFEAGMHEFDRSLGFVHIDDAATLYRFGDAVTGVRLRMRDLFDAPQVVRQIAVDLGGGFYVSDWTRRHANFFRSIQLTKSVMFIILLAVVGVAAFNIVSTLVMVVKDKRADIAILRTMGARPRGILAIFIIQGTVIGVIGTLLGVALGTLLAVNVEAVVHGLEGLLNVQFLAPDVYFISDLPAQVLGADVARIAVTALALSLLSTLYPAWRAARMQPAESLRHE